MNSLVKTKTSADAVRFGELVQAGIDSWIAAGKLLVERRNADPTFLLQVRQAWPAITEETLEAFTRIGRGLVNPRLLLSDSRPAVKCLLRLPIQIQQEYESKPIPVVVREGKEWSQVDLTVLEMTRSQSLQVFGAEGIRSPAAQKSWLLGAAGKEKKPWQIVGDRVQFTRQCVLSARELQKVLEQLAQEK